MNALTFRLRDEPPERIDLSPLTPDRLAGYAEPIAGIVIGTTRRGLCVGDL